jgi:diaminopimelate decarboxylase
MLVDQPLVNERSRHIDGSWAVVSARIVYDEAIRQGFTIQPIDVGGGFTSSNFEQFSLALRHAIIQHFGAGVSAIRWMAEPGRFLISDSCLPSHRNLTGA